MKDWKRRINVLILVNNDDDNDNNNGIVRTGVARKERVVWPFLTAESKGRQN
jgi:hypothetical protein